MSTVRCSWVRLGPILSAAIGLIALVATAAIAAPPSASQTTIVTLGTGAIIRGNGAAARQQAISDGLEAALRSVVVSQLTSENLVGQFQIVSHVIDGKTRNFVQGYKVLGEAVIGNTYWIAMETTIAVNALTEALTGAGVQVGEKKLPSVLLFVIEKPYYADTAHYWWGNATPLVQSDTEKAMAGVLENLGFRPIDPAQVPDAAKSLIMNFPEQIDLATVKSIAARYGAQMVIVGRAVSEPPSNTMGADTRTYQAKAAVRAYRLDSDQPVAEVEEDAATTGIDPTASSNKALTDAAERAAQVIGPRMAAAWQLTEGMATHIEMDITGTHDLANFVIFRRVVKNLPGVKSVQTREMKSDEATLSVDYQGQADALANALMLNTFEGFRIDITGVTTEQMHVALIGQ